MNIPKHLTPESKLIWAKMNKTYMLDDEQFLLLKVSLESYDRMQLCRLAIVADGILIASHTGTKHLNPAIQAEKIAVSNFLQSWRLLGCGEPPK